MPRLSGESVPVYRRHKASNQAVVWIPGRGDVYLGRYKSPESKERYNRLMAEWLACNRQLPDEPDEVTVSQIVNAYRKHARAYYSSNEARNVDAALRPLTRLYGRRAAAELGPLALQAVQQGMIALGWTRTYCNGALGRIKRMFKWAARQELVPAELYHRLQVVGGLPKGRTDAKESDPVEPVEVEHVHAILPHVAPQVAGMIELQLLTGMRPGEVCLMRTGDIDVTGKTWVYRPEHHKTEHHGHAREIHLGPKAQAVVKPFLKPLNPDAYIFDPRDASQHFRDLRTRRRKTPESCGNRVGSNRKRHPRRAPGDRYNVSSYRRAIARGCDKADTWVKGGRIVGNDDRLVPCWHPHRLRHTAATLLRKTHGIEAAQVILGHKQLSVTEIYAAKNMEAASRIMAEVG